MIDRLKQTLTSEEKTELKTAIESIDGILRSKGKQLSTEERRELVKARKGSDRYIGLLFEIARDCGLNLKTHPIDEVQPDIDLQAQLSLVVPKLETLASLANDTYNLAKAEVWSAFLDYYAVLSAMAARDNEIKTRLKPIVTFMSHANSKNQQAQATDEEPVEG